MAEVGTDGEELTLADFCLARAGVAAEGLATDKCRLVFTNGGEEYTVAVVPITEAAGKILVAVPFPVWHRKVNKRILPQAGLTKAVCVEVAASEGEDLEESVPVKVWVGYQGCRRPQIWAMRRREFL